MIYAEPHIKAALFTLLSQQAVPVREKFSSDKPEQILWGGFTNTNRDNVHAHNQQWTFDVEVVVKMQGTGNSRRVTEIVQDVLDLIDGLQLSPTTGLQLLNLRVLNIVPLEEESDTAFIIRRVITLGYRIHNLN